MPLYRRSDDVCNTPSDLDAALEIDVYPIYAGEMLTHLNPKQQGAFPDPTRFPPPPGADGKCGCLMVTYQDCRQGGVRLECIWQPLWDTQMVISSRYDDGICVTDFFQGKRMSQHIKHGRVVAPERGETNLETPGQLMWPKRFHLWEIELQFSRNYQPGFDNDFFATVVEPMVFSFVIGEKRHFELPVGAFYKRDTRPNSYYAPLPLPLFFPPVQNFRARLEFPSSIHRIIEAATKDRYVSDEAKGLGNAFYCRCILNGYLSREIP